MLQTVRVIYKSGQLHLLDDVDLEEGEEIAFTITKEEKDRQEFSALLRSWREAEGEEAEEQKETGAYLIKALDEDRLSNRKLFTDGNSA